MAVSVCISKPSTIVDEAIYLPVEGKNDAIELGHFEHETSLPVSRCHCNSSATTTKVVTLR